MIWYCPSTGPRDRLIVVLHVHLGRHIDLSQVGEAGRLPCFLPRLGEHWEQDRRKDSDNGNNYEQLDQGETTSFAHRRLLSRTTTAELVGTSCYRCWAWVSGF